ncbi:SDR family NAD(P)-dependent oxidoreductase [Mobilicoccus massiliensis]|uniref:SDR family NAD(P)-dependent oxidoreductase n=1 Tax=Mobilicoccus massiliensis TaxID=1522310 RepID=UPI00058B0157|nr:SDR family oxidoreductase [Mobilicoccus massiliensis]
MTTALVTGASAGIGRSFCHELARGGHDLVLVARNLDRLEELAREVETAHGVRTEVIAADLATGEGMRRVADRLSQDGDGAIDLLVNNAGFGLKTAFFDSDVADEERQLTVLCEAVLVLTHAAGRAMIARGRGHIVNVSSVASYVTMGSYSACKAFVTTLTQSLALDLRGTGVGITALCPGYTHTEFHQRMGASMSAVPDFMWLDSDRLVRSCLRDARAGKVISTPGAFYRTAEAITGVLPRGTVRALSAAMMGQSGPSRERNGR